MSLTDAFKIEQLKATFEEHLEGRIDVFVDEPRIAAGSDRIELEHFRRDLDKHLAAINRKVLDGRYTFRPFLEFEIPKEDPSQTRTISQATIRDGLVQRGIYSVLYPLVDAQLSEAVYGYRKRFSAHDAIKSIRSHFRYGRVFVFDADLTKFFDTLDHDILLEKVRSLGVDDDLLTLVRRFIKTGRIPAEQAQAARDSKKHEKYRPEPRRKGVPQGGVLSGLLANLYLAQFDATIRKKFPGYVRYADDFLVCYESGSDCSDVELLVRDNLKPLKVELNDKKTHTCILADKGVDFLGFAVSPQAVRIRQRNVEKFKTRIDDVIETQDAYDGNPKRTLSHLCDRLAFKLRGPRREDLQMLANRGRSVSYCRRSWIGFFRIVTDVEQIRGLDRWVRSRVSRFMWRKHRVRVVLSNMQDNGLPSLVNGLYRARTAKAIEPEEA